jgi:hypothetical protein
MTTQAKPKQRRRKAAAKPKTTIPVTAEATSFFAHALTIQGRFVLAWIMIKAAVRILIKGRALV